MLNDKRLSRPDLLQSLVGIFFRFQKPQTALSANIEATILQIAVPSDKSRCLKLLCWEDPGQKKAVYVYTRHLFGTNYALHQKAKKLHHLAKLLRTHWNTQDSQKIFSECGFNLTKRIINDEEVKAQIPETDRSTEAAKTFKALPQSFSILGINCNANRDSRIFCRGPEQEFPAKIPQRIVLSFFSAVLEPFVLHSPFTVQI